MRHAKAEPYASTDHARRLTDRGRAQAHAAGSRLHELGLVPDHAIVSTAERTVMTWAEVADATGSTVGPRLDPAVYTGGVDVLLETIQTAPDEATTVMFIGHNPAAAYLSHLLDDGEGDPEAMGGMLRGFPPAALVVFEVRGSWADLGAESARVTDFFAPG
jgi:phosphohistidine phosphatase